MLEVGTNEFIQAMSFFNKYIRFTITGLYFVNIVTMADKTHNLQS